MAKVAQHWSNRMKVNARQMQRLPAIDRISLAWTGPVLLWASIGPVGVRVIAKPANVHMQTTGPAKCHQ